MSSFRGKAAVVTGAGSGIGRALTLGLARRGARLALSDIDEAGLEETGRLAERLGPAAHRQRLDVGDREAFSAYADAVAQHFGAVHQLYNNAGIGGRSQSILDSGYEEYEFVLRVNLWGVIHGTKAFLPHLIASGDGHVVNVGSLQSFCVYPGLGQYTTAKFAVRGFTETLQAEMRAQRRPVAVTGVYPGGIRTNITSHTVAAARQRGLAVDQTAAKSYDERFLRMSPEYAAEAILQAVAAREPRVLVGRDATLADKVVRAMPSRYPNAMVALLRKMGASR